MDLLQKIKTKGYCHIPNVYSTDQIAKTLNLVKDWHQKIDKQTKHSTSLTKDGLFVWNLQNKDYFFLEFLLNNEKLQSILTHFLNDQWFKQIPSDQPNYILRSYLARSSQKTLPMHIDSFIPYLGDHIFALQAGIPLEDSNVKNGCLYVVPESHLSNSYTKQDDFQQAVPIEAKAGDLIIWDSRLWHSAGENISNSTRWSLNAIFSRWWIKQMFDITGNLPKDIFNKCTNSQKAILGFCSIPWADETQGIDMKRGYETFE